VSTGYLRETNDYDFLQDIERATRQGRGFYYDIFLIRLPFRLWKFTYGNFKLLSGNNNSTGWVAKYSKVKTSVNR
jgi:hypothetical protein